MNTSSPFLNIDIQGIRVRPMAQSDLPAVMELEYLGYSHPWSESTFIDCFKPNYRLWSVESDAELVGYAVVAYMVDEAHLLNICVSPSARNQGVGSLVAPAFDHYGCG